MIGRQLVNGEASKALVAVLTTVAAALPIYYGTAKWVPIVVMGLGAVLTYLVPNAPKAAAAANPAAGPASGPPMTSLPPAPPPPVVPPVTPPQPPGGTP